MVIHFFPRNIPYKLHGLSTFFHEISHINYMAYPLFSRNFPYIYYINCILIPRNPGDPLGMYGLSTISRNIPYIHYINCIVGYLSPYINTTSTPPGPGRPWSPRASVAYRQRSALLAALLTEAASMSVRKMEVLMGKP
jgi:hypothetical protein